MDLYTIIKFQRESDEWKMKNKYFINLSNTSYNQILALKFLMANQKLIKSSDFASCSLQKKKN